MKTQSMKTQSSKSPGWSLVLVALGLLALYSGPRGLALLVPAAILIWYAVARSQRPIAIAIDAMGDNRGLSARA